MTERQMDVNGIVHDWEDNESSAVLIDDRHTGKRKHQPSSSTLITVLVTTNIVYTILLLASWLQGRKVVSAQSTDFENAHSAIRLRVKTFEDKLRYNETTQELWRDLKDEEPKYFGIPSIETDAAWKNLLRGEFPGISDEEARGLGFDDDDRNPATGHFHIAVDVFHSLHCLNAVRKELDKDYYLARDQLHRSAWSPKSQRVHIDHCLNQIRQSLQCSADLSPAALKKHVSREGDVFFLGNADRHTCRDFDEIMRWMDRRMYGAYGAWTEM